MAEHVFPNMVDKRVGPCGRFLLFIFFNVVFRVVWNKFTVQITQCVPEMQIVSGTK